MFYHTFSSLSQYIHLKFIEKEEKNVGADKLKDIQYSSSFQIDYHR